MFKLFAKKLRTATLFEKLLLVVGLAIGIVGFRLINSVYAIEQSVNWPFLTVIFLWFMLLFLVILTDSSESIKEELSVVIKEHIEETRLLKEEVRLMRLSNSKKK